MISYINYFCYGRLYGNTEKGKLLFALIDISNYHIKVTEWPPIGKIAAHSAYGMFHGISA